jgi:hypothetical protein
VSAQPRPAVKKTQRTRKGRKKNVAQLRKRIDAVINPPPAAAASTPIVTKVAGITLPNSTRLPDPFGIPRDVALAGAAALERFPDEVARLGIDDTDVNRLAFAYAEMRRVELARQSPPNQFEVDLALWGLQ